MGKTYAEKLLNPRWQRRKTEILTRDNFTCTSCRDTTQTLHVHHLDYWAGREPWDYPDELLVTLCDKCHEREHNRENLEKSLAQSFKSNGFLISDLMALGTKLYTDREFTETLLKTLRDFQNG